MRRSVNPLRGKTTDRRAVCGKSARTVRREGGPNSIGPPYPYLSAAPGMGVLKEKNHFFFPAKLLSWEIGLLYPLFPSEVVSHVHRHPLAVPPLPPLGA